jgi:hypothetical protein
MTRNEVKEALDRVLTWPAEAQQEAVALLETIEDEFVASFQLSPDDREALKRSADDVRNGRFATDENVQRIFARYRRA